MTRRRPDGSTPMGSGDRRRERNHRPDETEEQGGGGGGASDPSAKRSPTVIRRKARRRVVEPGREEPARDRKGPKAGKGGPGKGAEKKEREQAEAKELAADKGIPVAHALRIVRGEVTLNEVLKALMRKERSKQLVERDGLERGLAGQVASGHLTRARALTVQRIRRFRTHRIGRDALKVSELDAEPVAIRVFRRDDWATGVVVDARNYEIDFRAEGAAEDGAEEIEKHDIKAVCAPGDLEAVRAVAEWDEAVRAEDLAGTRDRKARVRPGDEALLELVESEREVRCVFRDGEVLVGRIRSFGRWDLDLEVAGGAHVHVLFHALHPSTRFGA